MTPCLKYSPCISELDAQTVQRNWPGYSDHFLLVILRNSSLPCRPIHPASAGCCSPLHNFHRLIRFPAFTSQTNREPTGSGFGSCSKPWLDPGHASGRWNGSGVWTSPFDPVPGFHQRDRNRNPAGSGPGSYSEPWPDPGRCVWSVATGLEFLDIAVLGRDPISLSLGILGFFLGHHVARLSAAEHSGSCPPHCQCLVPAPAVLLP